MLQQVERRVRYQWQIQNTEKEASRLEFLPTIMNKVSGLSFDKPSRKRAAFELWADDNPHVRKEAVVQVEEDVRTGRVKKQVAAAMRQKVIRDRFHSMPVESRRPWELKSKADADRAQKEHKEKQKAPPSTDPVDRQKQVLFLPPHRNANSSFFTVTFTELSTAR